MNGKNTLEKLQERLNNDVGDIEAALSLGNMHYDNGDAPEAILYYRHVLDLNPALSGVRTDMGAMYWKNGDISLAEKAFRETIARDPGFGHAYVNLGQLLHKAKGNVTEARSAWQQLITISPDHEIAGKARELLWETAASIN